MSGQAEQLSGTVASPEVIARPFYTTHQRGVQRWLLQFM